MASRIIQRMVPSIVEPTHKHSASLIMLHGSGDNGENFKMWGEACLNKEMNFPHIRVIYPNATVRPYTPNNGMPSQVWFDRKQISPFCEEDLPSISESCDYIDSLIKQEMDKGIARNRIVLGGFSMGGALSLYYGYTRGQNLAGIAAISSFLADSSAAYENLSKGVSDYPPLFQCHGGRDQLVLYDWGQSTNKKLNEMGIKTQWTKFPNIYHELSRSIMKELIKWLDHILPDNQ